MLIIQKMLQKSQLTTFDRFKSEFQVNYCLNGLKSESLIEQIWVKKEAHSFQIRIKNSNTVDFSVISCVNRCKIVLIH